MHPIDLLTAELAMRLDFQHHTLAGFARSLRANPRDAGLWGMLGDFLEERPSYDCPPFLAKLTGRLVWLEDDWSHGVEPCLTCSPEHHDTPCPACGGSSFLHTFSLLFDHPGEEVMECERCSGEYCDVHFCIPCECDVVDRHCHEPCEMGSKRLIRGHLGELADWLRECGDAAGAEEVGRIRVVPVMAGTDAGGVQLWTPFVFDGTGNYGGYDSYPDACREAIRRAVVALTDVCKACVLLTGTNERYEWGKRDEMPGCSKCFGLGWVIKEQP